MQCVTAIILSNGLHPFRTVLRQILQGHGTAMLVGKLHQGLGNFAFVKSTTFGFGNGAQATRGGFKLKQLANIGRTTPRQEAFRKTWQRLQERCGRQPFLLHHHRHQVTALRNFNGGLHQIGKGQFSKTLTQSSPRTDRTGYRHRVPATLGWVHRFLAVFLVKVLWCPRLRCRT